MKIKELISYLNKFDSDAEIKVSYKYSKNIYTSKSKKPIGKLYDVDTKKITNIIKRPSKKFIEIVCESKEENLK